MAYTHIKIENISNVIERRGKFVIWYVIFNHILYSYSHYVVGDVDTIDQIL